VRLEKADIAVRLNLLGQPGEHPDFIVAAWVLPYVYALRGDRDWRRTPQLTGSRQVSPLAIQSYKLLETNELTIPQLKHALGREVSEAAVTRAITELWQQLRIIPVIAAPGQTARWQLLRQRFQKAIAEGASTSQVTAISVLASIYLQAVIAATMEEVELFLAPLTARSKIREVLRGLVATRQVHTISLGHAPHFYVAGTLPEFAAPPTVYASTAMPASSNFLHSYEHDKEIHEAKPAISLAASAAPPPQKPAEPHPHRIPAAHKPVSAAKPAAARPHFSRPAVHTRDRKPAQSSSNGRVTRHGSAEARGARWASSAARNGHGKLNGARAGSGSAHRARSNGTGSVRSSRTAGSASRSPKSSPAAHGKHSLNKAGGKAGAAHGNRTRAVAARAKSGGKRLGFSAPSRQRTKKRG